MTKDDLKGVDTPFLEDWKACTEPWERRMFMMIGVFPLIYAGLTLLGRGEAMDCVALFNICAGFGVFGAVTTHKVYMFRLHRIAVERHEADLAQSKENIAQMVADGVRQELERRGELPTLDVQASAAHHASGIASLPDPDTVTQNVATVANVGRPQRGTKT